VGETLPILAITPNPSRLPRPHVEIERPARVSAKVDAAQQLASVCPLKRPSTYASRAIVSACRRCTRRHFDGGGCSRSDRRCRRASDPDHSHRRTPPALSAAAPDRAPQSIRSLRPLRQHLPHHAHRCFVLLNVAFGRLDRRVRAADL
jgi:hypothetical protein